MEAVKLAYCKLIWETWSSWKRYGATKAFICCPFSSLAQHFTMERKSNPLYSPAGHTNSVSLLFGAGGKDNSWIIRFVGVCENCCVRKQYWCEETVWVKAVSVSWTTEPKYQVKDPRVPCLTEDNVCSSTIITPSSLIVATACHFSTHKGGNSD